MTNEIVSSIPAVAEPNFWTKLLEAVKGIVKPIFENLITYNGSLFKNICIGILIIIVGWLIAKIVQFIIKLILKIIHFDDFCDKTKITQFLENGGIHNIPSNSVSSIFYWLILLLSFVSAVDRVSDVSSFQIIQQIISFMPSAFLALIILVFGIVIGFFLSKLVGSLIANTGVKSGTAMLFEKLFLIAFIVFSAKIALNTVKIGDKIILAVVDDFFKYSFIGIAIAFGIGTRNFAEDFLAYYKIRSAFPKGSEIYIENERAIVKEIKLFHTLLYTEKGIIDVPNATLSRKIIKKVM